MAEVVLSGVSKAFGATQAVQDVTLTIPDGAFVVLLGPTGAGKTTLLRLIAGLEKADTGDVRIGGRSVIHDTPAQRDVAMVFQQYSLYPHLSVRDNLAFPLRSPILKTPEDEIARKVRAVAEVLQIRRPLVITHMRNFFGTCWTQFGMTVPPPSMVKRGVGASSSFWRFTKVRRLGAE